MCIVGAFGDKTRSREQVWLEVEIEGAEMSHSFVVAPKLTADFIIGMDFIRKYKGVIDSTKNIITFSCDMSEEKNVKIIEKVQRLDKNCADQNVSEKFKKILEKYPKLFEPEVGKISGYKHKIELR